MLAKTRRKGNQPSMNKISLHYTRHEYNVVIRFEKWRTQLLISTFISQNSFLLSIYLIILSIDCLNIIYALL